VTSVRGWVVAAAVFAGAFLLWNVLSAALSALLLLFTAILLAAGLYPAVARLRKRMPFGAAVGAVFGATLVVIVVLGIVLLQPLGVELAKLIAALPGYTSALQDQLSAAQRYIESDQIARQLATVLAGGASSVASYLGPYILSGPKLVAVMLGDAVLIVLLAVGWMLSSGELERFVLSLMPPHARAEWNNTFAEIGTKLTAYVQGVVLNGAVVGIAMGATLGFLGIPYTLLLGFVAAIFQAIPMVGAVISGPIILLVVLATSGWTKMLIALVVFSVVQIIDQNVLSPIIFGQRVQLSFLLIILATVIGGTLLGIAGAFLAVPAAAVLQVLLVRIVAPAIRGTHGGATKS
jgi:predicted PurR-regulated permease PerM